MAPRRRRTELTMDVNIGDEMAVTEGRQDNVVAVVRVIKLGSNGGFWTTGSNPVERWRWTTWGREHGRVRPRNIRHTRPGDHDLARTADHRARIRLLEEHVELDMRMAQSNRTLAESLRKDAAQAEEGAESHERRAEDDRKKIAAIEAEMAEVLK